MNDPNYERQEIRRQNDVRVFWLWVCGITVSALVALGLAWFK